MQLYKERRADGKIRFKGAPPWGLIWVKKMALISMKRNTLKLQR